MFKFLPWHCKIGAGMEIQVVPFGVNLRIRHKGLGGVRTATFFNVPQLLNAPKS